MGIASWLVWKEGGTQHSWMSNLRYNTIVWNGTSIKTHNSFLWYSIVEVVIFVSAARHMIPQSGTKVLDVRQKVSPWFNPSCRIWTSKLSFGSICLPGTLWAQIFKRQLLAASYCYSWWRWYSQMLCEWYAQGYNHFCHDCFDLAWIDVIVTFNVQFWSFLCSLIDMYTWCRK
jgi:hypothetical protein